MWSPKRNANGARNPFYDTVREATHILLGPRLHNCRRYSGAGTKGVSSHAATITRPNCRPAAPKRATCARGRGLQGQSGAIGTKRLRVAKAGAACADVPSPSTPPEQWGEDGYPDYVTNLMLTVLDLQLHNVIVNNAYRALPSTVLEPSSRTRRPGAVPLNHADDRTETVLLPLRYGAIGTAIGCTVFVTLRPSANASGSSIRSSCAPGRIEAISTRFRGSGQGPRHRRVLLAPHATRS